MNQKPTCGLGNVYKHTEDWEIRLRGEKSVLGRTQIRSNPTNTDLQPDPEQAHLSQKKSVLSLSLSFSLSLSLSYTKSN